ncbi:cytochrome P450 alkane hydroxylase [Penicillium pulvis]|uniref:cytochrome P450 alkane hydroxylase n=1 Tax=Penicillium pulvis TaxID=1562058 RepID=UPI00254896A7|nr:cytochrome P450 alkane hydroxylase [Penicillium pulvis]KAJ5797265.1 cytochrome P450 alkane hydroxylase [Penicillium pulvis]
MNATFPFQLDSAISVAVATLGTWKWLLLMTLPPLLVPLFFRTQRTSLMGQVTPGGPFGIFTLHAIVKNIRQNHFYEWMTACLDCPGHTAEMIIFGTRFILTEEPENIKAIFTSQFREYGKGDIAQKSLGHYSRDTIFTVDGPAWRERRKDLRPHITSIKNSDIRITECHVQQLLETIASSPGPIDVYNAVDKAQLNVALHRFLGQKTVADIDMYERFRRAKHMIGFTGTLRMFLGPIGGVVGWLISHNAKRDIDAYLGTLLDMMSRSSQDLSLFIDEGSAGEERYRSIVESKPTKELLLILLLAGKDPLVTGIAWTLYHLARHPEAVQRLRTEIASNIGYDRPPTLQDLDQMSFLKNVIRESMRLHPPVGFNFREALVDTTLPTGGGADGQEGIAVPKGNVVFVSVIGMQRRCVASIGSDADDWQPDRWDNWTPPNGEYVPFGLGPRVCPGQAFGQFQLEYTVVRILQRFSTLSYHGREQSIKFEINTKPAFPTLCHFHSRG